MNSRRSSLNSINHPMVAIPPSALPPNVLSRQRSDASRRSYGTRTPTSESITFHLRNVLFRISVNMILPRPLPARLLEDSQIPPVMGKQILNLLLPPKNRSGKPLHPPPSEQFSTSRTRTLLTRVFPLARVPAPNKSMRRPYHIIPLRGPKPSNLSAYASLRPALRPLRIQRRLFRQSSRGSHRSDRNLCRLCAGHLH